jgi:hypothetical protein
MLDAGGLGGVEKRHSYRKEGAMPDETVEKKVWSCRDQIINHLAPKDLICQQLFYEEIWATHHHPATSQLPPACVSDQPTTRNPHPASSIQHLASPTHDHS